MAYINTYNFEFQSNSGICYRLEFHDQGTGASSFIQTEGRLGKGTVKLKYDSDGSNMFAPLKSSSLSIDFLVTNSTDAAYIQALRTARQERDVYVYLYNTGTSHPGSTPSYKCVFAGYLLMDLSDEPDEAVPFNITLKAVDGLASLKYYDFIPHGTPQNADHLYSKEATFLSDPDNGGGQYPAYRTFIEWISKILYYTGHATTTEGNSSAMRIVTATNWANGSMASATDDSLAKTRCKPEPFYEQEGETGDLKYKAMNCYDALKSICTTWGMRCMVYRNSFYFIQINRYTENESGTLPNPDNIKNWKYEMDGTFDSTADSLDYYWGRYFVQIINPNGIQQKLSGSQYGILPAFKKVTVDFANVSNDNKFQGFPLLTSPWPSPVGSSALLDMYTDIGTFTFDGSTDRAFYHDANVSLVNNAVDTSGLPEIVELGINWTVQAKLQSSGTWRELSAVNVPSQIFSWVTASAATTSNPLNWMSGYMYAVPGVSTQSMMSPLVINNPAVAGVANFVMCPAADFPAGAYDFRYRCAAYTLTGDWEDDFFGHGQIFTNAAQFTNPDDADFTYTNTAITQGIGSSIFAEIKDGMVGSSQITTNVVQTGDDTEFAEVKGVLFGDCSLEGAAGNIQVYTGSAWVDTSFVGVWGLGTLGGSNSLTETLAEEIFKRQANTIKKLTTTIAQKLDYREYDSYGNRPIYPMPLSRFFTPSHIASGTTSANWIMHSGEWNPAADEWSLVLYEFDTFANAFTTTNTNYDGSDSGPVGQYGFAPTTTNGPSSLISNPNNNGGILKQVRRINQDRVRPVAIIDTNAIIPFGSTSQTVTSLGVYSMPTALLKSGDTILLKPAGAKIGNPQVKSIRDSADIEFTVSSDQGEGDTSIAVTSQTVYNDILIGDSIAVSQTDLISQYQNKTKGTIGGMTVTADSFDGAKSLGRQQVFFRVEGNALTETNYYILYGEDNNKSGRFGNTNSAAPDGISTQDAIKSGKFLTDTIYTIESGRSVITGTAGWDFRIILYKTTPVQGSTSNTTMTSIGYCDISTTGNNTTQIDTLTALSTAEIAAGDVIIPHVYAGSKGTGSSFNFRGNITFTLIRKN